MTETRVERSIHPGWKGKSSVKKSFVGYEATTKCGLKMSTYLCSNQVRISKNNQDGGPEKTTKSIIYKI